MGRLIDADALKKDFNLNFGGVSHAAAEAEIIDRQPTIDPKTLKPKVYKGEIGEAMENIEDVLDKIGRAHV